LVIGSNHFPQLPQLPQNMSRATRVVKNDSKITFLFS
jgi:hypothetical protein